MELVLWMRHNCNKFVCFHVFWSFDLLCPFMYICINIYEAMYITYDLQKKTFEGIHWHTTLLLIQLHGHINEGIQIAIKVHSKLRHDLETQHHLQQLAEKGNITQAYELLLNRSPKAKNQTKVMFKIKFPSNQATVLLVDRDQTLQEVLLSVCKKRNISAAHTGVKFIQVCNITQPWIPIFCLTSSHTNSVWCIYIWFQLTPFFRKTLININIIINISILKGMEGNAHLIQSYIHYLSSRLMMCLLLICSHLILSLAHRF